MSIICKLCGTKMPDDMNYCTNCGTKLEKPEEAACRFCPSCGAKAGEGDRFCSMCGYDLQLRRDNPLRDVPDPVRVEMAGAGAVQEFADPDADMDPEPPETDHGMPLRDIFLEDAETVRFEPGRFFWEGEDSVTAHSVDGGLDRSEAEMEPGTGEQAGEGPAAVEPEADRAQEDGIPDEAGADRAQEDGIPDEAVADRAQEDRAPDEAGADRSQEDRAPDEAGADQAQDARTPDEMICPHCGSIVPAIYAFCIYCGAQMREPAFADHTPMEPASEESLPEGPVFGETVSGQPVSEEKAPEGPVFGETVSGQPVSEENVPEGLVFGEELPDRRIFDERDPAEPERNEGSFEAPIFPEDTGEMHSPGGSGCGRDEKGHAAGGFFYAGDL